jgi:hypothetical protein
MQAREYRERLGFAAEVVATANGSAGEGSVIERGADALEKSPTPA